MGLSLKSLGKSLKKVVNIKTLGNVVSNSVKAVTKSISLNNLTSIATGDLKGVYKDVSGRTIKSITGTLKEIAGKFYTQTVNGMVEVVSDTVLTEVAKDPKAQNVVTTVGNSLIKATLLSYWNKYKTWVIVGGVAVVSTIVYFVWGRKKPKGRARR